MLTPIKITPGIVKDDAEYDATGRYVDADKVRFLRGKPQRFKGWSRALSDTFTGKCRGLHAWASNIGVEHLGLGTHTNLYAHVGGGLFDVTPDKKVGGLTDALSATDTSTTVSVSHTAHTLDTGDPVEFAAQTSTNTLTNPFTTTSSSATVTVTSASHGLQTGDAITFSDFVSVGGLDPNGSWTVASVTDADTYTFTHSSSATSDEELGGGSGSYTYSYDHALKVGGLDLAGSFTATVVDPDTFTVEAATAATATETSSGTFDYTYTHTLDAGLENGLGGLGYGVGGYSSGAYGAPGVDAEFQPRTWSIDNWGEHMLAVPLNGALYEWQLDQNAKAQPIREAPQRSLSMFVTPERHTVLLGTVNTSGTYDPLLVRWSDREDLTTWKATATNQAGDYKLSHGSRIVRAHTASYENLVWTNTAVYSMRFLGGTLVYGFDLLGENCGLIGPNAAVVTEGAAFWMAPNGQFYVHTGGAPKRISECPVRQYVFDALTPAQGYKVYAFANPEYGEVGWIYPADGNLECNRYVVFNYNEGAWSVGAFDRTAWIASGVWQFPIATSSTGSIYWQESGLSADGGPIHAFLETGPIDVAGGERTVRINRYIPDMKLRGAVETTIRVQDFPRSTFYDYGPFVTRPDTDYHDLRAALRTIRLRYDSRGTQDEWRIGQPRVEGNYAARR